MEVTVSSISKKIIAMKCLTVEQTAYILKDKNDYLELIKTVLLLSTNLQEEDFDSLTIQDAFGLIVLYRATFWDNAPITEEPRLEPSDFLKDNVPPVNKDKRFNIGDYEFTPYIIFNNASDAFLAGKKKGSPIENLKYWIMAAGCISGIADGEKAILQADADSKTLGELQEYNEGIKAEGSVYIDLLHTDHKIMLLSEPTGGTAPVAIPFRQSRFFSFWI